jgi:serine/threonine protein kinase
MAFAHQKGVLHRDLKPDNVMVGRYGEVYVLDWGLAKVLGEPDRHDLRIRPEPATASQVQTDRSREEADGDSPVMTMDGTVIGTPCYMAPEQAEGRIEQLDQRADVYAVGAMLYELLTGQRPYSWRATSRAGTRTCGRWRTTCGPTSGCCRSWQWARASATG